MTLRAAGSSRAAVILAGVAILACAGGCHRGGKAANAGTRAIEARLGAAGDGGRWRPFAAGRGALSLDEQSALERRGDLVALAEAELEAGRTDAADATLAKAAAGSAVPTPAVDNDRAVVALVRGDREGALDRLASVLARAPGTRAAQWNRALVLRELGLSRGAAAAFDAVAAGGEPGWSAEAKSQAQAIRARLDAEQREWKQARSAGRALIDSGAPPPAIVLQKFPSYVRHFLYHALRAAPTAARVRALAPLAATLDARQGGDFLAALVTRTAARDLKTRASLSATYARLAVDPSVLDAKAADAYVAALRKAHEDDLLLGTLILLQRTGAETIALARATGDPRYRALAADYEAQALVAHDSLAPAESLVVAALEECRAHALDYRCVHLESTLVDIYRLQHRDTEARVLGEAALAHAHAHARSPRDVEFELLMRLGDVAREREGFALMEAFLDEGMRADPESCEGRRWAWDMIASAHLFALDAAGARAALDKSPRCDLPISLVRAHVAANLARLGHGGADDATLLADLDTARAKLGPGMRAEADAFASRFALLHDAAAARKLADRALAEAAAAPNDVEAKKARAYVHLTRALDAAVAGDAPAALAALAADVGAPPPKRCALGVGVEYERSFAVALGPDGTPVSAVDGSRVTPALEPARLVPAAVRAALDACTEVAVYAAPPVSGLPELLSPDVAWSYRLRAAPLPPERTPRPRRVIVANPTPPPSLALPRLADWRTTVDAAGNALGNAADTRATILDGAAATPARVLAEIADATEIELHAHGLLDLGLSDAAVLALSPDAAGRFALSARDVLRAGLRNRPVVILGACRAAQAAAYRHEPFGLPLAFVRAGAAAVFASPAPIGDADAGPFFAAVLERIRNGVTPARALRDERRRVLATDGGHWSRQLLVFQ